MTRYVNLLLNYRSIGTYYLTVEIAYAFFKRHMQVICIRRICIGTVFNLLGTLYFINNYSGSACQLNSEQNSGRSINVRFTSGTF